MKEIRYASLLHDFGKVGVREEVLTKARKLYPAQMEVIRSRFDFARRTLQAESSERKLRYLLENGREEYAKKLPQFESELGRATERTGPLRGIHPRRPTNRRCCRRERLKCWARLPKGSSAAWMERRARC